MKMINDKEDDLDYNIQLYIAKFDDLESIAENFVKMGELDYVDAMIEKAEELVDTLSWIIDEALD